MKIAIGQADKYAGWKAKNMADAYSAAVFIYLERWADLMEKQIADGRTVVDCAKETSHFADIDGITGFMYGYAVHVLSQCWEHGEELRLWHNLDTQIGTEGEAVNAAGGVLNPAVMVVGGK